MSFRKNIKSFFQTGFYGDSEKNTVFAPKTFLFDQVSNLKDDF